MADIALRKFAVSSTPEERLFKVTPASGRSKKPLTETLVMGGKEREAARRRKQAELHFNLPTTEPSPEGDFRGPVRLTPEQIGGRDPLEAAGERMAEVREKLDILRQQEEVLAGLPDEGRKKLRRLTAQRDAVFLRSNITDDRTGGQKLVDILNKAGFGPNLSALGGVVYDYLRDPATIFDITPQGKAVKLGGKFGGAVAKEFGLQNLLEGMGILIPGTIVNSKIISHPNVQAILKIERIKGKSLSKEAKRSISQAMRSSNGRKMINALIEADTDITFDPVFDSIQRDPALFGITAPLGTGTGNLLGATGRLVPQKVPHLTTSTPIEQVAMGVNRRLQSGKQVRVVKPTEQSVDALGRSIDLPKEQIKAAKGWRIQQIHDTMLNRFNTLRDKLNKGEIDDATYLAEHAKGVTARNKFIANVQSLDQEFDAVGRPKRIIGPLRKIMDAWQHSVSGGRRGDLTLGGGQIFPAKNITSRGTNLHELVHTLELAGPQGFKLSDLVEDESKMMQGLFALLGKSRRDEYATRLWDLGALQGSNGGAELIPRIVQAAEESPGSEAVNEAANAIVDFLTENVIKKGKARQVATEPVRWSRTRTKLVNAIIKNQVKRQIAGLPPVQVPVPPNVYNAQGFIDLSAMFGPGGVP